MLVLLDDSCFARLLGGSHARARVAFLRQLLRFTRGNDSFVQDPFGMHARSFAWTRNTVTILFVDGSRALHVSATVRSSFANGPVHLTMPSLARAISSLGPLCFRNPCSLLRANTSLRTNRGPSGRSCTFVLRAEHDDRLLGSRAAPYCGPPQPFQLRGVNTIETLRSPFWAFALLLSCSPRRARTKSCDLTRTRARHSQAIGFLTACHVCSRCSFLRSPILRLSRFSASWSSLGARL